MNFKKILSIISLITVIALTLVAVGCKGNENLSSSSALPHQRVEFNFTVVHKNGTKKTFNISTDKQTVGDALQSQGIISGDDDAYGLYVKTVDGETLDYNSDGYWWAFYVGDEQSMTGVDLTEIEQGKAYSFKAEKS